MTDGNGLAALLASVAAAALLASAAACGADGEPRPAPSPTRVPSPPAETPVPSPEPTSAADRAADPPRTPGAGPADLEGRWEGTTTVPGQGELEFAVSLRATDGGLRGEMDIPSQNAYGLALSGMELEPGRLRFELRSPIGLAVWDGQVRGDVIEGDFSQAGLRAAFRLRRAGGPAQAAGGVSDGGPPRREDVVVLRGEMAIAGDLTLPEGPGPHPAAVLISGSGGQDRDSGVAGFRIFEVLADRLARAGVAVLRFDDRGTGGSGGSSPQATLQDRVGDVGALVDFLRSRPDIRGDAIGLIGHSEGGIVAPMVAGETDGVAFVVLLAAPAVRGDQLLRMQLRRILEVAGAAEDQIERTLAHQDVALRAVLTGNGWDEAEAAVREMVLLELERIPEGAVADAETYVDAVVAQQMALLRSPSYGSLVRHDPGPAVAGLRVPVLAVYGELDVQVPADVNSAAMGRAIAGSGVPSHTLATVPRANHLFQEAVTGGVEEYGRLGREFAPEFLEILLEWLAAEVNG